MRRTIAAALLTASLLAAPAGAAEPANEPDPVESPSVETQLGREAQSENPACGAYRRDQLYGWGPAWAYGGTVLVRYRADSCRATRSGDSFRLALSGTALVVDPAGERQLDSRPWTVSATITDPANPGWPPRWWHCGVRRASILWDIAGRFRFDASASQGKWNLSISGGGRTLTWSYNACG